MVRVEAAALLQSLHAEWLRHGWRSYPLPSTIALFAACCVFLTAVTFSACGNATTRFWSNSRFSTKCLLFRFSWCRRGSAPRAARFGDSRAQFTPRGRRGGTRSERDLFRVTHRVGRAGGLIFTGDRPDLCRVVR